MNRLDRALGILLWLRAGRAVPAAELARRFEVSARTIYRDVDTLAALGVPVYAEMGRSGGFRLVDGYFLPPVTFSEGEAISLLLGLALLGRLRARPFAAEQHSAREKLLAAVPDRLRGVLTGTQRWIGFETPPADLLHPEPAEPATEPPEARAAREGIVIETFVRGLIEQRSLALTYRSPYDGQTSTQRLQPLGLVWDRDRWYLAAHRLPRAARAGSQPRLWRADRVLTLSLSLPLPEAAREPAADFEAAHLLGRRWLDEAMAHWRAEDGVVLRVTAEQAARLRQDWYYAHALYEPETGGAVRVTFGEDDPRKAFALVRWLGPGAELLQPAAWRAALRAELLTLAAAHADPATA